MPTTLLFVISPVMTIIVATAVEGLITSNLIIESMLVDSIVAARVMSIVLPADASSIQPLKRS
jgi:hypothetical protein